MKKIFSRSSSSSSSRRSKKHDSERTPAVQPGEDKEDWEAEQKRLDREWYGLDEGYDDQNNPFAGVSEEYTKKVSFIAVIRQSNCTAENVQPFHEFFALFFLERRANGTEEESKTDSQTSATTQR